MAAGYLRYPHIRCDLLTFVAGPGKSRRPLPPRPGSLAASDAGAR